MRRTSGDTDPNGKRGIGRTNRTITNVFLYPYDIFVADPSVGTYLGILQQDY